MSPTTPGIFSSRVLFRMYSGLSSRSGSKQPISAHPKRSVDASDFVDWWLSFLETSQCVAVAPKPRCPNIYIALMWLESDIRAGFYLIVNLIVLNEILRHA